MLYLSPYPDVASRQLAGLVFYLTAFSLIDGDFDPAEKAFVRDYIRQVLEQQAAEQMLFVPDEERKRTVEQRLAQHEQFIEQIEQDIITRWTESIESDESHEDFVREWLEVRCFEIFQSFELSERKELLAAVDKLQLADGYAHPAELELRQRLTDLLTADAEAEPSVVVDISPPVTVLEPIQLRSDGPNAPFFSDIEQKFSNDPGTLAWQFSHDSIRIRTALEILRQKKAFGAGRLQGHNSVLDFSDTDEFLDGHVHVVPPRPNRNYELTVIGDLHGCYSCLKAALVQSCFFQRVEAFERSPNEHPEPRLVLLGDYIDRGRFSFDGVMRCVLKLLTTYPRYVHMLRGNHEWYRVRDERVLPAVWPAEGYMGLSSTESWAQIEEYRQLFETLPHFLLFGQIAFVHGGAPPDTHMKAGSGDLQSLNSTDLRMLCLWGDPSSANVIPASLQHQRSMRFSYGRLQLQGFLESIGCHTMIRGHEAIAEGFRNVFEHGPIRLFSLFSAGGATNNDLAFRASYRRIMPMALTVHVVGGEFIVQPWPIDYDTFLNPQTNGFYAT